MQSPYLNVENLSVAYEPGKTIVRDINFHLHEGELACLLGPSGCGKTTILRAIGGFHGLQTGSIELAGHTLSTSSSILVPEQRNVGMVFQDHALFPHLSISQNIAFGLHKLDKAKRQPQVSKMLDLVGMSQYADAYPHEISGGQSQRVALARALAPEPTLLLMDEPFSNLDSELRESLGYEVRQLLKETGITAIMVTHDQHDAFALGDQIGLVSDGELKQWGSPFELYHAPKCRFVARFIGDGVFLKGKISEHNSVITDLGEITGQMVNPISAHSDVDILLRPDDVHCRSDATLQGTISRKAFKGAQTLYTIVMGNAESLLCLVSSHEDYEVGDTIKVAIEADHLVCFERN